MNIQLTDTAKEKILSYNQNNMPVKVKITGYNWCGAKLGVVSEKQQVNDELFDIDGAKIIISQDLLHAAKGLKINYISNWFKKEFEVIPQ